MPKGVRQFVHKWVLGMSSMSNDLHEYEGAKKRRFQTRGRKNVFNLSRRITHKCRNTVKIFTTVSGALVFICSCRRFLLTKTSSRPRSCGNVQNSPGSQERPELGKGVFVYHVRFSHKRAQSRFGPVGNPRHFAVYRSRGNRTVIEIIRILHDSRNLARHVPHDQ
jgi:plasmid stabilization system protein ParE